MAFLKWVIGIPALIVGSLAIIWAAVWVTGSAGMMPRVESDMGTVILMLGGLVLLYPVMLFVWTSELRQGLRLRRDWDAMTPAAQAEAIAAAKATSARSGKRRKRREGATG